MDSGDSGAIDDGYETIAGPGEARFSVRGSTFLGLADHARTVDGAESFVDRVRDDHADATHVVPAYRVRDGESTPGGHLLREYASDDGEPTGSAGKPALTVLQRRDLENVVVAVVRHYGGTNLGVGGLARAYARAATEAVDDAGTCERRPRERLLIEVPYDDSGTVRGALESEGVEFEASYEASVTFDALVPTGESDGLRDRLRSATSGRVTITTDPTSE